MTTQLVEQRLGKMIDRCGVLAPARYCRTLNINGALMGDHAAGAEVGLDFGVRIRRADFVERG